MKVKQKIMKVKDLVSMKDDIDLNPQWQRGPVWAKTRSALLIDSILRDMDIPKIYLLRCPKGGAFRFEAVDGQQRIRTIFDFANNGLELRYTATLPPIDGIDITGKSFASLDESLVTRFEDFSISIAEIISADHDQVRQLFLRLQMGVALNPAELRNAIGGPVRNIVDTMALSNNFFLESNISPNRYKHQDYLAHLFTYADHQGRSDLKATNILTLYEKYDASQTDDVLDLMSGVAEALDILAEVNRLSSHKITQKWIVVDLFWFIYSAQQKGESVNANILADKYREFELRRKQHMKAPESLLAKRRPVKKSWDRSLYAYIQAFRTSGGDQSNLKIRREALARILK